MTILGLIPARSGSKRVNKKNIRNCGGYPLIYWSIKHAKESKLLNTTIVSTDCKEITNISEKFGANVPFLRAKDLAGDDISMIPVIKEAIDYVNSKNIFPEVIVLLQPTSPIRKKYLIDDCISKLTDGIDSVVTINDLPHTALKNIYKINDKNILEDISINNLKNKNNLFIRNGPSVVVTRIKNIQNGSLYGDKIYGVKQDFISSIDIDNEDQLFVADCILKQL